MRELSAKLTEGEIFDGQVNIFANTAKIRCTKGSL